MAGDLEKLGGEEEDVFFRQTANVNPSTVARAHTAPRRLCAHALGLVNRMGRNYPYPWSFPRRIEDTSEVNQELMVECLLRYCTLLLFCQKNALFFSAFKPDTIILLKLTG